MAAAIELVLPPWEALNKMILFLLDSPNHLSLSYNTNKLLTHLLFSLSRS